MLAVIPVRDGVLPAGAAETVAECGGRAMMAGSSPSTADLAGVATTVRLVELGPFEAGRWAAALADLIDDDVVVLPASADGRDLAPRLAHVLDRPLLAGAVQVGPHRVQVARYSGLELHDHTVSGPVVVTLQPGVRGVEPSGGLPPTVSTADPPRHGNPPSGGLRTTRWAANPRTARRPARRAAG